MNANSSTVLVLSAIALLCFSGRTSHAYSFPRLNKGPIGNAFLPKWKNNGQFNGESSTSSSSSSNQSRRSNPLFSFAGSGIATTVARSIENVILAPKKRADSERLQKYQTNGVPIASSFEPKAYNPHPLLTNQHLQTILGVFLRDEPGCAYIQKDAKNIVEELYPVANAFVIKLMEVIQGTNEKETSCDYWDERERIRTDDGDFFDVDFKYVDGIKDSAKSEGMVFIIHGLESNTNSSLTTNLAKSFQAQNFDVAGINFRGCSGCPNDTVYQYHCGYTRDLTQMIQLWTDRQKFSKHGTKPLYISGFSLGANVVLKCLGELSLDAVEKYNIRGAAVTGSPFNLEYHWRQLVDPPFQRIVYAGSSLKSMKKKVEYLTSRFLDDDKDTDVIDYWKCMNATTIAEIEDGMIAPLYGFEDRFDYYRKSSSLPVLDKIAVPTYVLNAKDDPFFSPTWFPWGLDCGKNETAIAPIKLERTNKGGHLGHLFHRLDKDEEKDPDDFSFGPSEMGRFIAHVHSQQTQFTA